MTRIAAKLTAHSVGMMINQLLGRPAYAWLTWLSSCSSLANPHKAYLMFILQNDSSVRSSSGWWKRFMQATRGILAA